MADTANELSEYLADCPLCGESIFGYDADFTEYGRGYAHYGCIQEYADDMIDRADYEREKAGDYDNRGNE